MLKCNCVESGITKTRFVKSKIKKKLLPPQEGGSIFTEMALKGATKGLYNLGRYGASKVVKSNFNRS